MPRLEEAKRGRSRREDAYGTLLSAIIFGDLKPASSIDEKRLVAEFQLSLAAVRDALNRLALEKMIERHARIGTYVPELSLREMHEVFEARILIEGTCAGLAAERASAAEVAALRASLDGYEKLIKNRSFRELVRRDQEFHRTLAAACRNAALERTIVLLHNNASRFWYYGIQRLDAAALSQDVKAHIDVVDAIDARDPPEAERRMRALLGHFPDFMRSVLAGASHLQPRPAGRARAPARRPAIASQA